MEVVPKNLRIFRTKGGRLPFLEWFRSLKDETSRQKIQAHLDRLVLGNMGKTRPVGKGVLELKINFGPGYRVYYRLDGAQIVILLLGGDKGSQDEDIKKAKIFWQEYEESKN